MKLKHILWIGAGIIVTVLLVAVVAQQDKPTQPTTQSTSTPTGEVQEVTVTFDRNGYVVTPATVEAGVPVRMTIDLTTVKGCFRSIVIPSLGIRKYVKEGDNVIEFTPTKSGPIAFTCSMNMADGKINVK